MRKFIFYPLTVIAYLLALTGLLLFVVYLLLTGQSLSGICNRADAISTALKALSKTNDCAKK